MTFKGFKNNKVVKIVTNMYVLIFIPFLIWMLFFDENSYLIHQKFNSEIEDLERTISFYKKKIAEDKSTIKKLQDSLQLEQFAREKYFMKKDNEDLYLIEFNTPKP